MADDDPFKPPAGTVPSAPRLDLRIFGGDGIPRRKRVRTSALRLMILSCISHQAVGSAIARLIGLLAALAL